MSVLRAHLRVVEPSAAGAHVTKGQQSLEEMLLVEISHSRSLLGARTMERTIREPGLEAVRTRWHAAAAREIRIALSTSFGCASRDHRSGSWQATGSFASSGTAARMSCRPGSAPPPTCHAHSRRTGCTSSFRPITTGRCIRTRGGAAQDAGFLWRCVHTVSAST